MALLRATSEKAKPKMTPSTVTPRPRTRVLAFVGGLVAALPLTVAAAIPVINAEVGASVAKAGRTVQVRAADATLDCTQPSSGNEALTGGLGGGMGGGGQVLGESTTAPTPPAGGGMGGGGNNQTPPPVIQKLVSVNGAITGPTGPDSNNTVTSNITQTTTVTNTNDISVSNSNYQTASSGNAEVEHNTSGGSAASGDASNDNSMNLNVSVKN